MVSKSPLVLERAGQVALVQLQHPLNLSGQLANVAHEEVSLAQEETVLAES